MGFDKEVSIPTVRGQFQKLLLWKSLSGDV